MSLELLWTIMPHLDTCHISAGPWVGPCIWPWVTCLLCHPFGEPSPRVELFLLTFVSLCCIDPNCTHTFLLITVLPPPNTPSWGGEMMPFLVPETIASQRWTLRGKSWSYWRQKGAKCSMSGFYVLSSASHWGEKHREPVAWEERIVSFSFHCRGADQLLNRGEKCGI